LGGAEIESKEIYFTTQFGALGNENLVLGASKQGRQRRILGMKVERQDPEHSGSGKRRIMSNECLKNPS
jgi:hypothetical protein